MTGNYTPVNGDVVGSKPKKLSRILSKLPLLISFSILGGTWLAFTFTITIPEVLLRRHDIIHFIFQCIIFNGLMGLTALSLLTASTRSPGHPNPSLSPFTDDPHPDTPILPMTQRARTVPATISIPSPFAGDQDDDIPLKYLRNIQWVSSRVTKDRPSPLPLSQHRSGRTYTGASSGSGHDGRNESADEEGGFTPGISPFPLGLSPFVPTTAEEAGDESDWTDESDIEDSKGNTNETRGIIGRSPRGEEDLDRAGPSRQSRTKSRNKAYWIDTVSSPISTGEVESDTEITLEQALNGIESEIQTLLADQQHSETNPHDSARIHINGGQRGISLMAKSTDGRPRWCKKCKGWKPDRCHHCRFCQRCVLKMDHHCVWLATCVGHQNYKPFLLFITYGTLLAIYTAVEAGYQTFLFFTDTSAYNTPGPVEVEFAPVIFMILTMVAGFFSLAIGGLTSYHWYLVCNNLTTLEQITHTYPTALLPPMATSTRTWKPEHLLSRSERRRLSDEAREINVYDLGWRRNIQQILLGSDTRLSLFKDIRRAIWPLSVARNGDGHGWEYDTEKLERLRVLTQELRLGRREEGGEGG